MLNRILFILLIIVLAGCSNEQQEKNQPPTKTTQTLTSATSTTSNTPKRSLMFFLDPNGAPCQMQDAILKKVMHKYQEDVTLIYVKTTIPSDRNSFYQYGIRSLPTLLLVDATGNEIKRMTPGVQKESAIHNLINSAPRS